MAILQTGSRQASCRTGIILLAEFLHYFAVRVETDESDSAPAAGFVCGLSAFTDRSEVSPHTSWAWQDFLRLSEQCRFHNRYSGMSVYLPILVRASFAEVKSGLMSSAFL